MNEPEEHQEQHVPVVSREDSPVEILHRASGLSRQRIKSAMTQGEAIPNGFVVRSGHFAQGMNFTCTTTQKFWQRLLLNQR
jgi:hypothetical protein